MSTDQDDKSPFFDFSNATKQFSQDYFAAMQRELREMKRPNIAIFGRTGVGKSALINAVFGENLAPVGSGKPVTQHFNLYENERTPVVIFDSKGWEGGEENEKQFYADTKEFLNRNAADVEKRVHMVWYLVDGPTARFTDHDINILRDLLKDIPVLFVITKGEVTYDDQMAALYKTLEDAHISNSVGILDVCAQPGTKHGKPTGEKYGLNELVKKTLAMLPELVKKAFVAAQMVNLELKDKAAKKTIAGFATLAGTAGFLPLGFSDWPILIGAQAVMAGVLSVIYGLDAKSLSTLVTGSTGALLSMYAGKSLVGALRWLLGPFGYLLSLIDATVSIAITWVLGLAIAGLFHDAIKEIVADKDFVVTTGWAELSFNGYMKKIWEEMKRLGLKKFIASAETDASA